MTRHKLTVAMVVASLAVPAGAQAAKKATYAGTLEGGAKIGIDVKLGTHKRPKAITEVRAVGLHLECAKSGPSDDGFARFDGRTPVTRKGRFSGKYGQKNYDNLSRIEGDFDGKTVSGTYVFDFHFQAEGDYPEENCTTGEITFDAERGADDKTKPFPSQRPARG